MKFNFETSQYGLKSCIYLSKHDSFEAKYARY